MNTAYMARKLGEALDATGFRSSADWREDRRGRAGRSDQRRWRDLCGIRVRCEISVIRNKMQHCMKQSDSREGYFRTAAKDNAKTILFSARNRIISGLAEVVVIAEAKKKSCSLITAEHALEQGKDIYVFPKDNRCIELRL